MNFQIWLIWNGGINFPQKGPWKNLNPCNWVLGRVKQRSQSMATKFRRGDSPAARGKWGKRFRSSRRSRRWPVLRKRGAEAASRRWTEAGGGAPRGGDGVLVVGVPEGGGEVARKLPQGDVVLVVCLAGAERGWSAGTTARPSGGGAWAHQRCGPGCSSTGKWNLTAQWASVGCARCYWSTGSRVWGGGGSWRQRAGAEAELQRG
jgi:hypothetical protein